MSVVTTCASVVLAMQVLDRRRLALIHPPWVSPTLTGLGAEWFARQGLDVVHASSIEVTGGQHDLQLGQLYRWARDHVPKEAQVVFFGGNGLRAVGVIRALEEDLDQPVLTANQVLLSLACPQESRRSRARGRLR